MGQLVKGDDGLVYAVTVEEQRMVVDRDLLANAVNEARTALETAEQRLKEFDELNGGQEPAPVETPDQAIPADEPVAPVEAVPETPAETPVEQPVPEVQPPTEPQANAEAVPADQPPISQ